MLIDVSNRTEAIDQREPDRSSANQKITPHRSDEEASALSRRHRNMTIEVWSRVRAHFLRMV